ncbi:MAG: hypothetical protein V3V72_01035 [Ignavibacteriaceae bacterium]
MKKLSVKQVYFKFLPFIFVIFLITTEVTAQVEVFGFGGYMVASNVSVREGDLIIRDNPNYGVGLDIEIERGTMFELLWIGQQTRADLRRWQGGTETLFNLNIHYFQGGAVHEFREGRKQRAVPFGSFTLGATLFDASDPTVSDEWRFSVTFGVGGKFYLSDRIGIRLQARLLLPINFSSVGFWCGTGGCGVGVGSYTTFVQADFTGGIFVKLGK